MYQLTYSQRRVLMNIHEMDSISFLPALDGGTIATLQEHGIHVVEDLINLEPIALLDIPEISVTEKDKLKVIYDFLFGDAYENLHG